MNPKLFWSFQILGPIETSLVFLQNARVMNTKYPPRINLSKQYAPIYTSRPTRRNPPSIFTTPTRRSANDLQDVRHQLNTLGRSRATKAMVAGQHAAAKVAAGGSGRATLTQKKCPCLQRAGREPAREDKRGKIGISISPRHLAKI